MTDTVFTQTPAAPSSTEQPQLPPEVVEFVGAGKKYASVDEALKSVPHAQKHIATIEAELALAKQELEKRKTAEQLVEEIKQSGMQPPAQPAPVSFDPARVTELVRQTLEATEVQKSQQSNISSVTSAFYAKHGKEQAEAMYIKMAQENGMTVQALNRLAAEAPSVVLKLAGLDKAQPPATPPMSSSVNTDGFAPQSPANLSARVPKGAKTKDIVQAWRNAGANLKSA